MEITPKIIKRFKSLQLEAGSVNKGQIHLLAKEISVIFQMHIQTILSYLLA